TADRGPGCLGALSLRSPSAQTQATRRQARMFSAAVDESDPRNAKSRTAFGVSVHSMLGIWVCARSRWVRPALNSHCRFSSSQYGLRKGRSPIPGATRSPLLHLQFTLDRKHLMPGHFTVSPEAQIHARLPHAELVQRDLRQPARKHGI